MTRTLIAAALLACATALTACASTTPGTAVGEADAPTTTQADVPTTTQAGATTTTTAASSSSCDYRETPEDPPAAGKEVGLPSGEDAPKTITLVTSRGEIVLAMDAETTPCTTASIAHLAESGFYDDSPCHRITKADSLSVLQCGDPSGQGTGGPGYTLPDENPTGLKPTGTQNYVTYPRGTVAMANTGKPHSGGSQFFLVYADSTLPPTYAVFATLDDAGLAVLDKVADGGITGARVPRTAPPRCR